MVAFFESVDGGGAAIALDEGEISVLRSLATQMLELIGPGDEPDDGADPLAALFAEGPSEPPRDPALARLFPDAYGDPAGGGEPDEESRRRSAEFRRFTENELRARKRGDLLAMISGLDAAARDAGPDDGAGAAVLTLEPDDSRRWLGALNDLRLTLAARLGIEDESDSEKLFELSAGDPRKPLVIAYHWLGRLQDTLIETLLN
ncbi:DUF2017 domain-containing protein [Streptomyces sp. RFCAC02]|uniref:DUF2017 domain-containing protein n=1 Tax=Streptomyces sp. RFCAC02 TaxID=2499143 RepID=UPI001020A6D8|nr:DUF2017 domain-containing protein [Streptomyces sp. RFCAC02]